MEASGVLLVNVVFMFSTFKSCLSYDVTMVPRERCHGVVIRGPCTEWMTKWYFNQTIQACHTFTYGGCKGENVFNSEAECLYYCIGGDHTLPPHLIAQNRTTQQPGNTPVPEDSRGPELTFKETGQHKVFMMAKSNAFIQLDGNQTSNFQLRLCRQISFEFRTRLPHGLLVYHSIKDRPEGLNPYALYVIVEKGQLKVVHVFGKHSTSVIVGEGLNRDQWHKVTVTIDVKGQKLKAAVNDRFNETKIEGLHKTRNYGVNTDLTSVVLIGGLSPEEKLHGVKYIIESFVGCIKNMILKAGKSDRDLRAIQPLIATKHDNVMEGCIDKCRTRENLCFVGSKCINHYNHLSCNCFGTQYEGELCDIYTATILTLRGASYVSYRVYDWKDRVHSSENRMGLHFKTHFDDSVLFYASGESPSHHHIAVSIRNSTVFVDLVLGEDSKVAKLGRDVTDNEWHNLTIVHRDSAVIIFLDNKNKTLYFDPGTTGQLHLYIDPEIYIGGGPELHKKNGLHSQNNFVGSLKYVFFNDISILYELNKTNHKVHYIGVLDPLFVEEDVSVIPMTFPFPKSHFKWNNPYPEYLYLAFEFKCSKNIAVLAAAEMNSTLGEGIWELRLVNDELRFELTNSKKNVTHVVNVKFDPREEWHTVELVYNHGSVNLSVDLAHKQDHLVGVLLPFNGTIIIGSTPREGMGLVGCLREIVINRIQIDPRSVLRTKQTHGQISLDNCELVDPCKRPNACEHNGKCSVKDDKLSCNCNGTGYIGKNCHFAAYRKTCEELALLGFTKPDVYLIDIDGNGKFPPAHVKCEFQSLEDSTKTIVEHNLPSQIDVRSSAETDFSFTITYREFTSEMLQELISHSLYCSQYIKYDCYKAPLELHSATWFISAANNGTVDYIGKEKRGSCPCAENRTCMNPDLSCNCDISEAKWLSDEGGYISPNALGITQMVFLQQSDLDKDAQGRITLGPLECVETNTQKYVVTFTTSQSYIEVPGWRKGDIAFSFRTTGEKAILLYQPPIRPHHPSFMVTLTGDFKLSFNFTLNTGHSRELEINSKRKLNSGEWQKIWIDYNEHHVRFMINTDYQMVDLLPEEEFGPFEGSMFIGGASEEVLVDGSVRQGLIGCFRGLVVNGEILDIYSYMSVHLSEIIKDCKPSCDPNPCKNGARCKELWSTFQCVCENPWAYIGEFCETNINENGLKFVLRDSFFSRNYFGSTDEEEKSLFRGLLSETFLLNLRTYDNHSLVLHANDHLNNFVQLYIHENNFVFLFNSDDTIYNVSVDYPGLSSGKSIQVAVVRSPSETKLHVNEKNATVMVPIKLLTNYSNKPWSNPEREVLAPQRPPAPPTDYFQVSLGGYDSLLNSEQVMPSPLSGFIGCIRGFKIGDYLVNLTSYISTYNETDLEGILSGCEMKCDSRPCLNQGVCIENFLKGESTCDCEFTSYYGEFCGEEKGADFGGESVLQRNYTLVGPVNQIKVQLAFSSSDLRERKTTLLLLQTENKRSFYLLVALSAEGELIFEEDREGSAYGARIKDRNFLNGARHSVYYRRQNDTAVLMIDREQVQLSNVSVLSITQSEDPGANEVQIGGISTSDPRFGAYTSYLGCLSNVFIEVNNLGMKPLDEYMLFTKAASNTVFVKNPQGVRSARCSSFEAMNKPRPGPSLNNSFQGQEQTTWVIDPPARVPYKSQYSDPSLQEDKTGRVLFFIAVTIFCVAITGVMYHVYRTHVAYKRRKVAMLWRASQVQYQEPPVPIAPIKSVRSRSVCEGSLFTGGNGQNGRTTSLQDPVLRPAIKLTRSKSQDDSLKPSLQQNGVVDLRPAYKSSPATPAPVVRFRIPSDDSPPPYLRENGVALEKFVNDEEDKVGILKTKVAEMEETVSSNGPLLKPNMESVLNQTIDEDCLGERAEEEEDERNLRPDKDSSETATLTSSLSSLSSIGKRRKFSFAKLFSNPFMSEGRVRTFANPLSYLGGPRFPRSNRNSKESIMSLD